MEARSAGSRERSMLPLMFLARAAIRMLLLLLFFSTSNDEKDDGETVLVVAL